MRQKKDVAISCIVCFLCLLIIVGILVFINCTVSVISAKKTSSYEELVVHITFWGDERDIKVWYDAAADIYYFFLPSGSEKCHLTFGNLSENSTLCLGENIFRSGDYLEDKLEYQVPYEAELKVDGESLGSELIVFMKSENLPSLFIDTASGGLDNIHANKDVKEAAVIALFSADGREEYGSDIEYIKSRGNSTFMDFEKKSYQIKLYKATNLLGMEAAKKWILLANAIDDMLIRNDLVFQFAEKYSAVPSIQGEFVDLYVNGNYVGNYYLCEKVEIGENRLNITDLEKATESVNYQSAYESIVPYVSEDGNIHAYKGLNNPEDITGGYLVMRIAPEEYETMENSFRTEKGFCYQIVSPQVATVEQARYICEIFSVFEAALMQPDGIHPKTGKHFSEYFNIASWASKYMMEEVFHDPDADVRSMYFYKDSDIVDSRICSGPMWDYDRAIGGYGAKIYEVDNPEQIGEFGGYVEELMKHERVRQLVYERFEKDMIPYVEYLLSADVYGGYETLKRSYEMNRIRWPRVYGYYQEVDASRDYLISFLERKVEYLQKEWLDQEDFCNVVFLDYYGNEYASYAVKRGECLETIPNIATWGGIFNGWYSVDGDILLEKRRPIYEDVTYRAKWIELSIILQNGVNSAQLDVAQADPEIFRQLAEVLEKMQQEDMANEKTDRGGEE